MIKSEKTEEGNNSNELQLDSHKSSSPDKDVLSDCGDDFCECPELSFRPVSRDLLSDEEFVDAETESGSMRNSLVEPPLKPSLPRKCDEYIGEESKLGLIPDAPNEKAKLETKPKKIFEEFLVPREGSENIQAAKRFKVDKSRVAFSLRLPSNGFNSQSHSGRGDCRSSLADRMRSFSRIPVAAGRQLVQMAKPPGSKGRQVFESLKPVDHEDCNLESLPHKPDAEAEIIVNSAQEKSSNNAKESELQSKEDLCREDINLENEIMENIPKVLDNEKEILLAKENNGTANNIEITMNTEKIDLNVSNVPIQPSGFSSNPQAEFVVLTLAEERLKNQKVKEVEVQKKTDVIKTSGYAKPQSVKRTLDGTGKGRSRDLSSSHRLKAMIRDRSGQALVKQERTVSRDNSRPLAIKTQKTPDGRISANTDVERPGNRLQVIRQEKAQIRQRMSEVKPLSPMKARKTVGTPTMKKSLTNPLVMSLKKEIAARRPDIEQIAMESEVTRNIVPSVADDKDERTEIALEEAGPPQPDKDEGKGKIVSTAKEGRTLKLLDQMNTWRSPRTAGELTVCNPKAELCSLSAKYQARLKKYEAQKTEVSKTHSELYKTATVLNQLRESILSLSGDDPGEVEVTHLVTVRPLSSCVHASSSMERIGLSDSSSSVQESADLFASQLQSEKSELEKTSKVLMEENELLKLHERERGEKELMLKKELISLQNSLKESEKKTKDLELKVADRDTALAQLRGNIAKVQDLPEKLKLKDNQIVSLRRQFAEESKEHNIQLKRAIDAKEAVHQAMVNEKDQFQYQLERLKEENDSLKINIDESSKKALHWEEKICELQVRLEKELRKNKDLEAELMTREKYVINLERKLEDKENTSTSILGLSEQLMQKDTIISELEKHRTCVQSQNRELCTILSSTFKQLGQDIGEEEIEGILTGGRIKSLKNKLTQLIDGKTADYIDNKRKETPNEYQNKINQLEHQVAVLQAELQESKNYSESLAGVISDNCPWNNLDENSEQRRQLSERGGSEGDHSTGRLVRDRNTAPSCLVDPPTIGLTSPKNGHITEIRDLFISLECKRQALMRMERKMQELEEIHANCAQKRVRNEVRIDKLEMMLAAVKNCYKSSYND